MAANMDPWAGQPAPKKKGLTPEVKSMLMSQLPQFGAGVGKLFDTLAGRKPYTLV